MLRSRASRLQDVNLLELSPQRASGWSEEGGRVVVKRSAPPSSWRAPIEWLSYKMSVKRVRLDEVGSFAWRLLDGRHTVAEVAEALRAEFGDRVEPVEERLGRMLRALRRERLIDYPEDERR